MQPFPSISSRKNNISTEISSDQKTKSQFFWLMFSLSIELVTTCELDQKGIRRGGENKKIQEQDCHSTIGKLKFNDFSSYAHLSTFQTLKHSEEFMGLKMTISKKIPAPCRRPIFIKNIGVFHCY